MRLFIAAQLKLPVLNKIASFLEPLRKDFGAIKWLKPENLHLTFKFLGETDIDQVDSLKSCLYGVKHPVFRLSAVGLGAFPDMKAPKVLWIGLKSDGDNIFTLHKNIEDCLQGVHIPPDSRKYRPHLTIARIKTSFPTGLRDFLQDHKDYSFGDCEIDSFKLMESRLSSSGAIYDEIQSYPL